MRFRFLFLSCILILCAACGSPGVTAPPATARPPSVATSRSTGTLAPSATPQPAPTRPTSTPVLLPNPSPIPEIHLLFTGDINPGRCVYYYSKQQNDLALPYRPLADLLQSADIAVGSLDATLSDYNPPVPCQETRNLLAPAEAVQGMQFAGFDVMTVATNHIKDCGLVRGCVNEAMFDTLKNLRAAGIQPTGAGSNLAEATTPVIISVQGVRFAFLGFSAIDHTLWATDTAPGTAPFQPEIYLDAIRRAKAQADVVVVLPHWGTEYSSRINWEQITSAQAMVDAGATLVIGNHPHHVQGVETFPNSAVAAYALGNFVFDQTWSDGTLYTLQGLLLQATFRGTKLQQIELLPIHIYDDFQPRLAPPEEAKMILAQVEASFAEMPKR
jgi:poly-gamma-glutamate synthesis protein (capsule biosynthesis protein)